MKRKIKNEIVNPRKEKEKMGNKTSNVKEKKGNAKNLGKDMLVVIALKCAKMDENMIFPLYCTCKLFYNNKELKVMFKEMKIRRLLHNTSSGNYNTLKITFIDRSQNIKVDVMCKLEPFKYVYNLNYGKVRRSFGPYFVIYPPGTNKHNTGIFLYRDLFTVYFRMMAFGAKKIKYRYVNKTVYLEIEKITCTIQN